MRYGNFLDRSIDSGKLSAAWGNWMNPRLLLFPDASMVMIKLLHLICYMEILSQKTHTSDRGTGRWRTNKIQNYFKDLWKTELKPNSILVKYI